MAPILPDSEFSAKILAADLSELDELKELVQEADTDEKKGALIWAAREELRKIRQLIKKMGPEFMLAVNVSQETI